MRKLIFVSIFNSLPIFLLALTGWTDPAAITNATGNIQDYSFSVSLEKGIVLLSYSCDGGSSNNGVYFKNSAETTLTWSLNTFLSTVSNDAISPSVSGRSDYIYNAWLDNNSGVYKVLIKKGLTDAPIELSGAGNCTSVNIFAGRTGNVHAVWSENGIICYRKGFNNGSNWSDVKTISGITSDKPFVFEAGSILIIVWQGGAGTVVRYSTSSDGGLTWSAESNISSSGIAALSCSVDTSGYVYAVWEQANKVYFRKYKDSGWEMEKTISTNSAGTAKNPAVTVDTDGIIYSVWTDNRTGDYKIYLTMSVDAGVTFSPETVIGALTLPCKIILGSFKKNLHLLYLESGQIMYRIKDTSAPSPVSIKSPAYHPAGGGCNNNCPVFFLEAADNEGGTGIKGFSYVFDKSPSTLPPQVINLTASTLSFSKTENGSWYLHIKAIDFLDNWSETAHFVMNINNTSLLPESEVWSAPNPVKAGQKPVIRYFVPEASSIELSVFNEAGDILIFMKKDALLGINEIRDLDVSNWGNGVYFYRLKAKSVQTGITAQLVKKILLLRER